MEIDNVKLWFARDQNNEIITISDINENNKHNKYICPMCSSNLIPKAIKSKQITSHFAHIDASKCNSETMIHFWFKNKFLQWEISLVLFQIKKGSIYVKKFWLNNLI